MTTTFSPVRVTDKQLTQSKVLTVVTLEQTEYNNEYTTEDNLKGLSTQRPSTATRRAKVRMSHEEAEKFTVGQEVPGHLQRSLYTFPLYPKQEPSFEGGYSQTMWLQEFSPDKDNRLQAA